jgi:predicted transcriptional regulator
MHENSLKAYSEILNELPKMRRRVLIQIRALGKATIEETALALGRYPNQVSGRFSELRKANLIKQIGSKVVNGKACAVWGAC